MALMSSFFKEKKDIPAKEQAIVTSSGNRLTLETLKQLIPIRNLSEDKLGSFIIGHKPEILPENHILFTANEPTESAIYLLKGKVSLSDSNGTTFEIEATETKAKFPLSSGLKHTTTATALSEVNILRVSKAIMSLDSEEHNISEINIPDRLIHNRLLQTFSQHFIDDELQVPSLPRIAIQLRNAMKNEIGIEAAVKIVQLDPVISAKLIDIANCPLYVSLTPAKSCFEAIKRIGLNATRSLVISLSIKNIFKSDLPLIKSTMEQQWQRSVYLSSLCFVLASASKQSNPEEALLAGLVADIGIIPFLKFITNLPTDYYNKEEIIQAIPVIKGVVGASILKKWGFTDEFIEVPLLSDDWYQHSEGSLTYTDIVVLSRLHSKIGKKSTHLPAITSIPAASKLKSITLSPENSLSILHDAKDKVNEALKSFSA